MVPQPETVHMVPGGSQRAGRLTFFTVDDSLARLLSFTSMMSLTWVWVEYSGWTKDRVALIFCALRLLSRSLPMCTLYSLREERPCDCWREGWEPIMGDRDPGTGDGERGGGCGGGESGCRRHLPHLAVSCGEHPHLVDQHAATVELTALEQGHLPGVGALCAWNSFDDPVAFISVWMETWRRTWAASIWPRSKAEASADGSAETEAERGGRGRKQRGAQRPQVRARRGYRCARGGAEGASSQAQGSAWSQRNPSKNPGAGSRGFPPHGRKLQQGRGPDSGTPSGGQVGTLHARVGGEVRPPGPALTLCSKPQG